MIATPEASAGHRRQLRGCLGARARTLVEIMWMLNTHRNLSTFCNCLHRHDSFFLCADAMQVQSSEALYQSKMHHKSFGGGLRQDPLAVFKRSIDPSRGQRRSGNKGWGKGRRKKKEGREGREEGKKAKKRGRCGPFFQKLAPSAGAVGHERSWIITQDCPRRSLVMRSESQVGQ